MYQELSLSFNNIACFPLNKMKFYKKCCHKEGFKNIKCCHEEKFQRYENATMKKNFKKYSSLPVCYITVKEFSHKQGTWQTLATGSFRRNEFYQQCIQYLNHWQWCVHSRHLNICIVPFCFIHISLRKATVVWIKLGRGCWYLCYKSIPSYARWTGSLSKVSSATQCILAR